MIIRVSPYSDGTPASNQVTNTQSFTVTLRQTPTAGNTLIACAGLCPIGNGATVSSIIQGGNSNNWTRNSSDRWHWYDRERSLGLYRHRRSNNPSNN
jgi:hypothetical protein